MEDRRTFVRREAFVAVAIEADTATRWLALTRNISRSGALLLTQARLQDGQDVCLQMVREHRRHEVPARVVRQSALLPDGIWTSAVAVAFDRPLPEPALSSDDAASSGAILFGPD